MRKLSYMKHSYFACLEGDINKGINSQDVLSSWRAYGKDGRGVCLTYESQHFLIVTQSLTGFRLSRVIYDEQIQIQIVDSIINEGYIKSSRANDRKEAVNGTVGALMFMMPAMKNTAFEEEKEWRVIYLPEDENPKTSRRKFYVSDGLIIPYYS